MKRPALPGGNPRNGSNGSSRSRVLRVVHHYPGRLRARAGVFEDRTDAADRVREALAQEPGITSVHHNARSGSVLVVYEPGHAEPNALLDLIVDAAGLDGVIDEVNGHHAVADIREEVFAGTRAADAVVSELTGGRADLRTVVAGALFATSMVSLFVNPKSGRLPRWDNLLWWSYGIISGDPHRANDGDSQEQ